MDKELLHELNAINEKLSFLTVQVQDMQQKSKELDELKKDLSLIGKDIFNAAVDELEDVAPYFDMKDLVHLLKKLLRNTGNINKMMTQMESAADLFEDLKPISKKIFNDLLETMDELDRKGYFEFLRESVKIIDTIVTSFEVEDVQLLRENITSILLTVKSMTQPQMLNTVDNALGFFRKMDIEVEQKVSYRSIIKSLRDPEVKRGLLFMLQFTKNMAAVREQSAIKSA